MRAYVLDLVIGSLASGVVLLSAGLVLAGTPAPAASMPAPTPVLAPDIARSRTLGIFEKHCASCHQADRPQAARAATWLGNILSLDDLAGEPGLVEPGRPDASRLYHVLLQAHRPLEVFKSGSVETAPSADDVEALRDWIATLPPRAAGCPERPAVSDTDAASLVAQWRDQMASSASDTRFVSLAHLSNACHSESDLARYRQDVAKVLAKLGGGSRDVGVEAIGDMSVILAFRLSDAGLTPEAWDKITSDAPRSVAGAVAGDWLAHQANDPAGLLSRRYREDVGLKRAAAELGTSEEALAGRLDAIEGPGIPVARQLRQGLVTRGQWESLYRALAGLPAADIASPAVAGAPEPLRLGLWSDKAVYKAGELASMTAAVSADCYLTLIGVDRAGNATVLYPNDFEPDNLLRGGSSITIPAQSASYQLRVKEPGTESVIGICSTANRRAEGILPDYARQRFTVLGAWRAFVRSAPEREAEIIKNGLPKGRRRDKSEDASSAPSGSNIEARTAIEFTVE